MLPTVTPVPETSATMAGVKFAPCTVTVVVDPSAPLAGTIALVVGTGGMVLLSATGALLSAVEDPPEATTRVWAPTDPPRPNTTDN